MAGAGYKLFNTGDVLTAAQVNTYLQQQVTMVFANATARTTALSGVLAEGMMSYLQDTNAVEVYDGSNWVSVGNTGDITGVTAGTGLTGGGTSGTVTLTNDMATTITTKGDLVVGTGAGTYARLAAGTNNYTLVADSAETTGLKWQAPAGGGLTWSLLSTTSLSGSTTITVSGISAKQLHIVISGASTSGNSQIRLRFNSDTANHTGAGARFIGGTTYAASLVGNYSAGGGSQGFSLEATTAAAAGTVSGYCFLPNADATTPPKIYFGVLAGSFVSGSGGQEIYSIGGVYNGTSAITSISLLSDFGNFDAGNIYLYGGV